MMMFAIITPALITGATANRLKFAGYAVVIGLWSVIVYAPVAHWLWSPSGWLAKRGAEDWAGGLVVHASAGSAVLALLLVIGHRRRWPNAATPPHGIPMVVLGAGILWFGWFGFNAGDGLQANGVAAQALINTQVAAAAAMLVWLLVDRFTAGTPPCSAPLPARSPAWRRSHRRRVRRHVLRDHHRWAGRAYLPSRAPAEGVPAPGRRA